MWGRPTYKLLYKNITPFPGFIQDRFCRQIYLILCTSFLCSLWLVCKIQKAFSMNVMRPAFETDLHIYTYMYIFIDPSGGGETQTHEYETQP